MTDGVRFDSTTLAANERFEAYHDLYSNGADVVRGGGRFRVRMAGRRLDRSLIYDRRLGGVGHDRNGARVRRDAMEHLTLTLVVSGEFHADPGDGFERIAPGEVLLLDMTQPMRNRAVAAHVVTMSVARERVGELVRDPRALHGRTLPIERAALLGDHMRALTRHGGDFGAAAAISIGRAAIDLLGGALTEESDRGARNLAARADRVRAFIEEHLFAPAFGPEAVLRHSAMSRATLYRAFEPYGGLAAYIRRRRIEALGERLGNPRETRSLADLAWQLGFSTEARQSEAFLAHYGVRPGAYRRAAQHEAAVARATRRMREWQSEVR
jgi:AraC-like DNA-binding protein